MWELFTHPSNLIFSICLSLMFLLGLLELILLVLGLVAGTEAYLTNS